MSHALIASSSSLTGQEAGFLAAYFGIVGIVVLVTVIFGVVLYWKIATKAGYAGPLSLLMFVPFVNFVVLIMFAFTEWPIQRRLREATGGGMLPPGGYVPPGGGGYAPPPQAQLPPYGVAPQPPYGVPPPPPSPPHWPPDPPESI